MLDIAQLLKDDDTVIAVVGANDHPSKYGYVIYRDLKRKGYRVLPVNPNARTVDGDPAYPSIAELPIVPTIVNFVTPPVVTLKTLAQCKAAGLMNVWIQPGAESPEVLDYVQQNGFHYLANACIMVMSRVK